MPEEQDNGQGVQQPASTTIDLNNYIPKAEYERLKGELAGAKGFAAQEKARADRLAGELQTADQNYQGEIATLTSRVSELETSNQTLTTDLTKAQSKVAENDRRNEIRQKIKSDYKDLLDLHDDELLRTENLEGEDLDNYLERMSKKFKMVAEGAKDQEREEILGGASPEPAQGTENAEMTMEQLQEKLMTMSPTDANYRQIEAAYLEKL